MEEGSETQHVFWTLETVRTIDTATVDQAEKCSDNCKGVVVQQQPKQGSCKLYKTLRVVTVAVVTTWHID